MKVLVSGGAGFIGSHLVELLFRKGHQIRILDCLSSQIHGTDPSGSETFCVVQKLGEFIKGDVRSCDDWHRALAGADAIVHLAAETGTGQSMYEIERYVDVNVRGTAAMLDVLGNSKHQVRKLVLASSRAVYGEGSYLCEDHGKISPEPRSEDLLRSKRFDLRCSKCNRTVKPIPTSEFDSLRPSSVYGLTKLEQENLVRLVAKQIGFEYVVFRFQNVYGPRQSLKNPYTGILSIFSNLIRTDKNINVFEDGHESRDFVYVTDAARAIVDGLFSSNAKSEVYNVGGGARISVLDVAKKLTALYGRPEENIIVSGDFRLGDIRHNEADLTRIKADLNFIPQVTLDQGLIKFTNWAREQQPVTSGYEKSLTELKDKGLMS